MLSIVFLVPRLSALSVAIPLIIICITAIAATVVQAVKAGRAGFRLFNVLVESIPSLVAYLGMLAVSVVIGGGATDIMLWLLPVYIILLAISVRNAWSLLVNTRAN
jgi:hypothetical protein